MSFDASPAVGIKTIEVNTGNGNHAGTPVTLIVVDSDILPGKTIIATQSGEAATGTYKDENELDHFTISASVPDIGGSMELILRPHSSVTLSGKYKINYVIG